MRDTTCVGDTAAKSRRAWRREYPVRVPSDGGLRRGRCESKSAYPAPAPGDVGHRDRATGSGPMGHEIAGVLEGARVRDRKDVAVADQAGRVDLRPPKIGGLGRRPIGKRCREEHGGCEADGLRRAHEASRRAADRGGRPIEEVSEKVVAQGGFEPPTPRFSVACSTN